MVVDCSMERRPGNEYSFNDPLLENVFDQGGLDSGDVVVAPAFLFPGNHAGEDGDLARILKSCKERHPTLKSHMANLVCDAVNDDLIVRLIEKRASFL